MAVVVGDIGGTKTHLAVAEPSGSGADRRFQLREECRYSSLDYPGLASIVKDYLGKLDSLPTAGAFAVAGPVAGDRCEATNLPWKIDARELESDTGLMSVRLLNDLEAIAWGVAQLADDQLETLHPGNMTNVGNAAVVAPGTGLGQAGLYWDGQRYRPFATEGGHHDFAPVDAREFALLEFLQRHFGHVSWERVVSGMGIENMYHFLLERHGSFPHPAMAKVMARDGDVAATVAGLAAQNSCNLCVEAMDMFATLLGRETGNVALKLMARGGVYLAGGIVPKNLELIKASGFLGGFFDKGRMRPLLEAMPVRVILDERTPLLGAAAFLSEFG